MILVDGEAEDELTNQHLLKWGLNYLIGQHTFRFSFNKYHLRHACWESRQIVLVFVPLANSPSISPSTSTISVLNDLFFINTQTCGESRISHSLTKLDVRDHLKQKYSYCASLFLSVVREFSKIAVEFIKKGTNSKMYQAASRKSSHRYYYKIAV